MIAYINSISGVWTLIIDELNRVVTYIDSYPVLYTVGLLFIMVTVVQIFGRLSRVN